MNVRFLQTDDIFISYSRGDASTYAPGLADRLIQAGFSCFIDRYGTDPDRDLPETLKARIRSCRMFVLIATARAAGSEAIEQEIVEFCKTGRASRIVPIDVEGSLATARWLPLVEGIASEPERNPAALTDGNPCDAVVSRIEKSFQYVRGKERLRRATIGAAVLLAVLLAIGVGASVYAVRQVEVASGAVVRAKQAQDEAAARGREATEAARSRDAANHDRDDARRQRLEAEALRDRARAEAERQGVIADAGREANAARQLLQQRPLRLLGSVELGIDALKKAASMNAEALGADPVLRDALALLPRYLDGRELPHDIRAVSPDGRHFVVVQTGRVVAYAFAEPARPVAECQVNEPGEVAVSNGAEVLAVERGSDTIEVCDVNSGRRSQFRIRKGSGEMIRMALSPRGRYVAAVYRDRGNREPGENDAVLARLFDARDGRVVLPLSREMGVHANDVAFGPNGNLAIAGKSRNVFKRTGAVALWYLAEGRGADWESFPVQEPGLKTAQHEPEEEVQRVAPGLSLESFATHAGADSTVWRRATDGRYAVGAYLPRGEALGRESVWVNALSFSLDGTTLVAVRSASDPGTTRDVAVEWWQAAGHVDSARVANRSEIRQVGFRPDGDAVAVAEESNRLQAAAYGPIGGQENATGRVSSDRLLVRAVSADARIALASVDASGGEGEVWDFIEGRRKPWHPKGGAGTVLSVTASTDRRHLVVYTRSGDRHELVLYALSRDGYRETGQLSLSDAPRAVALSPGGIFVVILHANKSVGVRPIAGAANLTPSPLRSATDVERVLLAPGGEHLMTIRRAAVAGSPSIVQVWRTSDGAQVASFSHAGWVPVAEFSPRGRFLFVAAEDGRTSLVDMSSGRVSRSLPDVRVYSAAFSHDEHYYATGSLDGVLKVRLTAPPQPEVMRMAHTKPVTGIAFRADNRFLASGSGNEMRVFLLRPADLLKEATSRLEAARRIARPRPASEGLAAPSARR